MAQRCKALNCPDDDLPDDFVFCIWHWDLLGSEVPEWRGFLCDAYGTERWCDVLAMCVAQIREIEAKATPPW